MYSPTVFLYVIWISVYCWMLMYVNSRHCTYVLNFMEKTPKKTKKQTQENKKSHQKRKTQKKQTRKHKKHLKFRHSHHNGCASPMAGKRKRQVCRTAENFIWIALKLFCQSLYCMHFYLTLWVSFICACMCTYNLHKIYFGQNNILPIWLVDLYKSSHMIYKVTMS